MSDLTDLLTTMHELNRWIVVAAAAFALGVVAADWARRRPRGQLGRTALLAFLGTLCAQLMLGVLIVVGSSGDAEPFEGNESTLIWHAAGGVFALIFATIAVLAARRHGVGRSATIWTALAALSVGLPMITMPAAAVVGVVRFLTTRRTSAPPREVAGGAPGG